MDSTKKPTAVIVGGGFGGINAAKILAKENINVVMIDRKNHHLFQPLLYQVATAGLSPADIATPIRAIMAKFGPHSQTFLAEAKSIDLDHSILKTDFRDFAYDYLILACGAQHSYFGHNEWEDFAPGLKTLEQAREIRRRVFLAFELAEREDNREKTRSLLTFVVIGGGPTGVELAGTLGEISRYALSKEFSHIDPACTRVILLEAGKRILPSFSKSTAKRALKDLEALGVQVWTESAVTNIDKDGVHIDKERISATTVLWAAGVAPAAIGKTLEGEHDRLGRVIVEADLSLKNHPNVFVIGDMAHCKDSAQQPLPGVASVAIQQGRHAAKNVIASIKGKARKEFRYVDKGQMATIGRGRAVAEMGKARIEGFLAWIVWLAVHIYYLIGFRNRLLVMTQWALAFFSFRKGARIIQNQDWKSGD
jgi:NADH dehydrogenase